MTRLFNPFFLSHLPPTSIFVFFPSTHQQVALPATSGIGGMIRPVTGADVGIRRAEIRPGLREIILCKDQDGKVGLRLRAIDNVSRRHKVFNWFSHELFSRGRLSQTPTLTPMTKGNPNPRLLLLFHTRSGLRSNTAVPVYLSKIQQVERKAAHQETHRRFYLRSNIC